MDSKIYEDILLRLAKEYFQNKHVGITTIESLQTNRKLFVITLDSKRLYFAKFFSSDCHGYYRERDLLLQIKGNYAPNLIQFNDKDFLLITNYIEGQSLASKASIESDVFKKCAFVFGKILNIDSNYFPPPYIESLTQSIPLVSNYHPKIKSIDFTKVIDNLNNQPKVGCHRDFHPENILITSNKEVVIVDFESYGCETPSIDMVKFCFNPKFNLTFEERISLLDAFRENVYLSLGIKLSYSDLANAFTYWAICCAGFYLKYFPEHASKPTGKYYVITNQPIKMREGFFKEFGL